jgi:hypothetical protein
MKTIEVSDDVGAAFELLLDVIKEEIKKELLIKYNIEYKPIIKENRISKEDLEERMRNEKVFDAIELSSYLSKKGINYSVSSIRSYRSRGIGPKSFKFGNARGKGNIIYFKSDVDEWFASSIKGPSSYKEWKAANQKLNENNRNNLDESETI